MPLSLAARRKITVGLSSGVHGGSDKGACGVVTFPIHSLFNGEPESYSEFLNHLIVVDEFLRYFKGDVYRENMRRIVIILA